MCSRVNILQKKNLKIFQHFWTIVGLTFKYDEFVLELAIDSKVKKLQYL